MTRLKNNTRPSPRKNTLRAQVESAAAAGKSARQIAQELDAELDYVSYLVSLYRTRPTPPAAEISGDDAAHIDSIATANGGRGFPFLTLPASFRMVA